MSGVVLLCTVGGSHQPILQAINTVKPRHIFFFCTGKDPVTGKSGSVSQITGEGLVIKASFGDRSPSLPNIPTQASLVEGAFKTQLALADDHGDKAGFVEGAPSFETRLVPADDLDGAWTEMRETILLCREQFPNVQLIADYTGGTKTMTAALVCAALEFEKIELQLVTGARTNLERVTQGAGVRLASVSRLRLDRQIKQHLAPWRRFAYREAEAGLGQIGPLPADAPDGARLGRAIALSRSLALWDDFDHKGSLEVLAPFAGLVSAECPWMMDCLGSLSHRSKHEGNPRDQTEALSLLDLWRNAERRAAQGRFDDAVARWYRMMEWTAQWQIRKHLGVDTADFPSDLLPPGVSSTPSSDGKHKIGLYHSWRVIAHSAKLRGRPAQEFAKEHGEKLRGLLDLRNNSILAHGFEPVSAKGWADMESWTFKCFLPLLHALAEEVGIRKPLPQLPQEPLKFILTTS